MNFNGLLSFLFIMTFMVTASNLHAKGNLSARAEKITIELGSEESDYHLHPKNISLETGKAYVFEFNSSGFKDYNFEAPEFFANIWIRSIEVEEVSIDVGSVRAISFEETHEEMEAEMVFVPIRPGLYPFVMRGLESRDMLGIITVR